ncbi:hypothetical protein F4778DRAFT_721253 [Xylariomycetidae sp. FL2044]|nr:hypothetical protein F4778DRAFT_721253 [Xylariomycetidae sp. FL2044]
MSLQFIGEDPSTGISVSARRIIRSHVMRGKNAGRPRPSKKKPTTTPPIRRVLTWSGPPGQRQPRPQHVFWNDLSLTTFPHQLDAGTTKLIHHWFSDLGDIMWPPQFCSKFDMIKSIWGGSVLADAANFHGTLAISASYVDLFERKPRSSHNTLHHISRAYSLVNLKLSSPESVSDAAIAAVILIALYDQIHRQPSAGSIHLRGLYRMTQLRGGIQRLLQENRTLALKALRIDIELALQNGTATLFRGDEVLEIGIPCEVGHLTDTRLVLSRIMACVSNFANLLNKTAQGVKKLDSLYYSERIVALASSLLRIAPMEQHVTFSGGSYDELAHLGMLAFMTTLLVDYGGDYSPSTALSRRLEKAIWEFHETCSQVEAGEKKLLLWVLFIGGIWVLNFQDRRWILTLISETCDRLSVHDWTTVRHQLCQFPWVFSLHDEPGQRLWMDAKRHIVEIHDGSSK